MVDTEGSVVRRMESNRTIRYRRQSTHDGVQGNDLVRWHQDLEFFYVGGSEPFSFRLKTLYLQGKQDLAMTIGLLFK